MEGKGSRRVEQNSEPNSALKKKNLIGQLYNSRNASISTNVDLPPNRQPGSSSNKYSVSAMQYPNTVLKKGIGFDRQANPQFMKVTMERNRVLGNNVKREVRQSFSNNRALQCNAGNKRNIFSEKQHKLFTPIRDRICEFLTFRDIEKLEYGFNYQELSKQLLDPFSNQYLMGRLSKVRLD